MSERQIYYRMLAFQTPRDLDDAVREFGDTAIRPHCKREDHVLSVAVHGSLPASRWSRAVGALSEIAARADRGHVMMLYDGDGHERAYASPPAASQWAHAGQPAPSAWFPIGAECVYEVRREGHSH